MNKPTNSKKKGTAESRKTINRMTDAHKLSIIIEYRENTALYNNKPLTTHVELLKKRLGDIPCLTAGGLRHTAKLAAKKYNFIIAKEPAKPRTKVVNPNQHDFLIDPLTGTEIKQLRELIAKYYNPFA